MKYCKSWILTLVCLALATSAFAQNEPARVRLETTKGAIVVELDAQAAPKTTANFLAYVDQGFYDNTIFHRVIRGFMIQGGGFAADMRQKPTQAPIQNEADNGLKNKIGTIAMARTGDPHGFHQNVPVEPVIVKSAKRLPPPTPPAPPAPALK
ncbi:MAG: peptidylprolyl isomerase [Desulfatitalea sp.]|nr:peptidylprolyl isomerase [Desulfatitalea sp.]